MKKSIIFLYIIAILSFGISTYCVINLKTSSADSNEKPEVIAKNIILRQENGYLQWKYDDNNSVWTNLLKISDLAGVDGKDGTDGKNGVNGIDGKNGINGIDGRNVEFRVSETLLQYRYSGDTDNDWIDLIDFSTINGSDNNHDNDSNIVKSVNGDSSNLGCYNDGTLCENGTSMTIMVNSNQTYDFYVLNDDGNNLTLISSTNIGNDTINTVPWFTGSVGNNSNGPITAIESLITLTSDWSNIKKISSYSYINSGNGYKKLNIIDGEVTIINSNNESLSIDGIARARLLTYEEAYALGCRTTSSSSQCPSWLYDNLDGTNNSLKPYGYWLLTSYSTDKNAYNIRNTGILANNSTVDTTGRGIRPVIKISKGN